MGVQHARPVDKAQYFCDRMRAPAHVAVAVAAASIDANITFTPMHAKPRVGEWLVLQCSCGHAACYKVLAFKAMYEAVREKRADPTACPAQRGGSAATFSEHVVAFYEWVRLLLVAHVLIWDWHNIPGQPKMHIDCTAVVVGMPELTLRFEVDGRRHFDRQGMRQLHCDWVKDQIMNEHSVSFLRLHYEDEISWVHSLIRFVNAPEQRVVYTPSYWQCLQGRPEQVNVRW